MKRVKLRRSRTETKICTFQEVPGDSDELNLGTTELKYLPIFKSTSRHLVFTNWTYSYGGEENKGKTSARIGVWGEIRKDNKCI
jgi:hypothetical protein